jgi:hypothetical protein
MSNRFKLFSAERAGGEPGPASLCLRAAPRAIRLIAAIQLCDHCGLGICPVQHDDQIVLIPSKFRLGPSRPAQPAKTALDHLSKGRRIRGSAPMQSPNETPLREARELTRRPKGLSMHRFARSQVLRTNTPEPARPVPGMPFSWTPLSCPVSQRRATDPPSACYSADTSRNPGCVDCAPVDSKARCRILDRARSLRIPGDCGCSVGLRITLYYYSSI